MPDDPVIMVKDVSFSYGETHALERVNLTVEGGGFICMIGPNGGGKTTLLRLLLGLIKPDSGQIQVMGQSPQEARSRIGYVPQYTRFDLLFPVTVADVVLMGRLRKRWGFYSRGDRLAVDASLEEVGLTGLQKRPFSDLSGGQRQRVLIARALSGNPEILMLDEPTANVDSLVGVKLNTLFQRLNRRMSIILATHDMGFVMETVRGVVCVNRKVVFHPTSQIDEGIVREAYGTDMRLVRHDMFCSDEELTIG